MKFWFDGGWYLHVNGTSIASGNVVSGTGGVKISNFNKVYNAWHNIAIKVVENKVTAYLDDTTLYSYNDSNPKMYGRVYMSSVYYNTISFLNRNLSKLKNNIKFGRSYEKN